MMKYQSVYVKYILFPTFLSNFMKKEETTAETRPFQVFSIQYWYEAICVPG